MKNCTHKIFHWLVIITLAIAPLRGVMAMNISDDQMQDESSGHLDVTSAIFTSANYSVRLAGIADNSKISGRVDTTVATTASMYCCSGDVSMTCKVDCSISVNMSLTVPSFFYSPIFNKTINQAVVHNSLLFRELTPPFRPPTHLPS